MGVLSKSLPISLTPADDNALETDALHRLVDGDLEVHIAVHEMQQEVRERLVLVAAMGWSLHTR